MQSRVRKYHLLNSQDHAFLAVMFVSWAAIVVWLLSYWCQPINYQQSKWLFFLSLAFILVHTATFCLRLFVFRRAKRPIFQAPKPDQRVALVTTFVAGEAPHKLVEQTLSAMLAVRYPHDTYLLDETNNPELQASCNRLGVRYFTRCNIKRYNQPNGRFAAGTRHGNYNAWLDVIGYDSYDFVAVFDLDHMPEPNYLDATLGYFSDPEIGYVQPPQIYYNKNESWIARAAAEKTYRYYSVGQMSRFGCDMTILDGCHNVNRTRALKQIGGFQPHKADDLLTTLEYVAAGWKGVYVPKVLAKGQAPMDLKSFFVQQFQWAYTTLDIKLRHLYKILPKLTHQQKFSALIHGSSYFAGAKWFATHMMLFYMAASGNNLPLINWHLVFYVAPIFAVRLLLFFWQQRFYIDREDEQGLQWRNTIASYVVLPYYLIALIMVPWRRIKRFQVISKCRQPVVPARFILPHSILILCAIPPLLRAWSLQATNMGVIYLLLGVILFMNSIPILACIRSYMQTPGASSLAGR